MVITLALSRKLQEKGQMDYDKKTNFFRRACNSCGIHYLKLGIAGESMKKSHPRQGKNRNITNSDCHVHAIQNSNPSTLTCYTAYPCLVHTCTCISLCNKGSNRRLTLRQNLDHMYLQTYSQHQK